MMDNFVKTIGFIIYNSGRFLIQSSKSYFFNIIIKCIADHLLRRTVSFSLTIKNPVDENS